MKLERKLNFDITKIPSLVSEGLVVSQRHPRLPLQIYNYTPRVQYERLWTPETMACRGLVIDDAGRIAARPFPKFFNWEEVDGQIPALPCDVYEKLDGSLGIVFNYEGERVVATRGSFASTQAQEATRILDEQFPDFVFPPEWTFLFEILYPENRIVVDYGGRRDLVLLAVTDTLGTLDIPAHLLDAYPFRRVNRFDFADTSLESLKQTEKKNAEGYVLRFSNGFRVKVKFDDYKRLHKIVTGLSTVGIWEALVAGRSVEELCKDVPDEFYGWCRSVAGEIRQKYDAIERECVRDFVPCEIRKDTAAKFLKCRYPSVLFAMLDRRDHAPIIWKMVRPERSTNPFRSREQK